MKNILTPATVAYTKGAVLRNTAVTGLKKHSILAGGPLTNANYKTVTL